MNAGELQNRIKTYVRKTGMLTGGDRVLICLSGGADSVFLFYFLKRLAQELTCELRAVHVHHGIRGEEADRDEVFVRELCAREGIQLAVFHRDVPKEAAERNMSLEETGRLARYDCFRKTAEAWAEETGEKGQCEKPKIALAHHRDDQAETVLFRIARGTGIAGLKGMEPVRTETALVYIRPLLCAGREEIREYLTEKGIPWVEDSTNEKPGAARNRIRRDILPLLASEVNSAVVAHLAGLAEKAAEADAFLAEEAKKRGKTYIHKADDGITLHDTILEEPAAMRKAIVARAICEAAGASRDITDRHIESVLELVEKESGRRIDLAYGIEAVRSEAGLFLRKRDHLEPAAERGSSEGRKSAVGRQSGGRKQEPIRRQSDGQNPEAEKDRPESWTPGDVTLEVREMADPMKSIPQLKYTKWLDYDKMNDVPSVRTRQNGDFLTIDAEGHTKTLSDYFTDEKVPKEIRGRISLVADGHEIAWVVGYRIGYRYRVTSETRNVLIASYRSETEC